MKIDDKWIGYCTNVHAGSNLEITRQNLQRHALQVKKNCAPESAMGIGLWLSDQAAIDMISRDQVGPFRDWLAENGLLPFTFNGFPYGDFHQDEVKKLVYLPTWAEDSRREYSERLAQIQHELLPAGMEGSISTLPLGWKDENADDEFLDQCADQLIELAEFLADLEEKSGRLIYYCIEPEPGCVMQTSQSCVDFFQQRLLGKSSAKDEVVKRYLRVCHDICHSAVMFEDQHAFIRNITSSGIRIGKVQVSSAVHAVFNDGDGEQNQGVLRDLGQFSEPRYMHQTVLKKRDGEIRFHNDLPQAMEELNRDVGSFAEARVHFHVPIFLAEFGALKTSQTEILQCLEATQSIPELIHYEAETYAWNVLPEELQKAELADGISDELQWLAGHGSPLPDGKVTK